MRKNTIYDILQAKKAAFDGYKVNWADVSEQIKSVFTDTDIEILVCKR